MTPALKAACRSYLNASRELVKAQQRDGYGIISKPSNPYTRHWMESWKIVAREGMYLDKWQYHRLYQRLCAITARYAAQETAK